MIVPTALYEAEAWGTRNVERRKVNVLEMKLWHMPHGIDLHATLENSYRYYLILEQPSPARIHTFMQLPFLLLQTTFRQD